MGGCPSLVLAGFISQPQQSLGFSHSQFRSAGGDCVAPGCRDEEQRLGLGLQERRGQEASFKSSLVWGALSHVSVMPER